MTGVTARRNLLNSMAASVVPLVAALRRGASRMRQSSIWLVPLATVCVSVAALGAAPRAKLAYRRFCYDDSGPTTIALRGVVGQAVSQAPQPGHFAASTFTTSEYSSSEKVVRMAS
jgi:hypothetical protein